MTPKQRNSYYLRKYGITAAEHDERGKDGCEICGSRGKKRGLHADHSHATRRLRILVGKGRDGQWKAVLEQGDLVVVGASAKDARQTMRERLKTLSYRGAICFNCNRGLRCFRDNPEILNSAALYLLAFQNRLKGGAK